MGQDLLQLEVREVDHRTVRDHDDDLSFYCRMVCHISMRLGYVQRHVNAAARVRLF